MQIPDTLRVTIEVDSYRCIVERVSKIDRGADAVEIAGRGPALPFALLVCRRTSLDHCCKERPLVPTRANIDKTLMLVSSHREMNRKASVMALNWFSPHLSSSHRLK